MLQFILDAVGFALRRAYSYWFVMSMIGGGFIKCAFR
jgi:hypothetical protein